MSVVLRRDLTFLRCFVQKMNQIIQKTVQFLNSCAWFYYDENVSSIENVTAFLGIIEFLEGYYLTKAKPLISFDVKVISNNQKNCTV